MKKFLFVRVALVLLLASIIYGSFFSSNSDFKAYAVPPAPGFLGSHTCASSEGSGWYATSCCWKEVVSKFGVPYERVACQTCVTYYFPIATGFECRDVYYPITKPGVDPIFDPLGGAVFLGGPNILPFDLRDILTMAENQSYSVSVRHGPTTDTITIEIPKSLSNSIVNHTNLNRTATGLK
jgi:hypothetical protein